MSTKLLGTLIVTALLISITYVKKKGATNSSIFSMLKTGVRKAMILVQVFTLIGMLTASWMASGTIPFLIKTGIEFISPNLFVVCAFLLCAAMSFVTGSSFGTTNSFGVVLIVIARVSGVDLWLTAGAILSGVYVGDRCSPMSSALLLVTASTETDHYENVKLACKTSVVPVAVTALIFLAFSFSNPMESVSLEFIDSIKETYDTGVSVLLPVLVLFTLCLFKTDVKIAVGAGALTGAAVAVFIQKYTGKEVLSFLIFGFKLPPENSLSSLVTGGGIASMASVIVVVFFACLLSEVMYTGGILKKLPFLTYKKTASPFPSRDSSPLPAGDAPYKEENSGRLSLFFHTSAVALVTAMAGCNQVMPIIITSAVEGDNYRGLPKTELVRDLTKTAMLLPMLPPWNIAILTPVTMLGLSGIGYIPYLFYLYVMLLCAVVQLRFFPSPQRKTNVVAS